jgi:acyl carrier protein
VQIYILDEELREVPSGSVGEIYVGGAGLARGYIRRPELDKERFIPNPFSPVPGDRLYKTGDLAKFLPDDQIAFVGRADDQIKLRGYRIEPNEIVTVLEQHPAVRASAVVAREDTRGDKNLVAYVVPASAAEFNPQELRDFLRKCLPDYMVPGVFVCLDQLPLLPSGKLNRAALPEPTYGNSGGENQDTAPRRIVEQRLAALLEVVLGVKRINVSDNFFLLGGHSLLGAQLIAQIRDAFGVELPLRSIFDFPTVAELSAKVEELIAERISAMTPEEIEQALAD